MVKRFKSLTAKRYRDGFSARDWPSAYGRIWQRNYYEHVIRDELDLDRIRGYILDNPAGWAKDHDNPHPSGPVPADPWIEPQT